MKKQIIISGLVCYVAQSCVLLAQNPGDQVPDRYIVQLKSGVPSLNVAKAHGAKPDVFFKHSINGFCW